jgi:methanogenic corrinoid protein MtbC1
MIRRYQETVVGQNKTDGDHGRLLSSAEVLHYACLTRLVLHAWERRYGLQPAKRTETGRRFYTQEQAERLRLLKSCSDAGHRIGSLIDLGLPELRKLDTYALSVRTLAPLIDALRVLDGEAVFEALHARADAQGPAAFISQTVLPLLAEIGRLWADGRLAVASEHLATAQIKRILGTMLDQCSPPHDGAPRLIATTLVGEDHEIGALIVALVARLAGWNALFLGPALPVEDIAGAVSTRGARYVCLSGLNSKSRLAEPQLRELRKLLPTDVALWVGGPGLVSLPPMHAVETFHDLDEFEQKLALTR